MPSSQLLQPCSPISLTNRQAVPTCLTWRTSGRRTSRAWAAEPDWDLLVMVEMGPDRMHHGFLHRPVHPEPQRPEQSVELLSTLFQERTLLSPVASCARQQQSEISRTSIRRPRRPQETILYQVVQENLETTVRRRVLRCLERHGCMDSVTVEEMLSCPQPEKPSVFPIPLGR